MPASISLSAISFKAGGKNILNNISLAIYPGEITAILGPSGSGKSTLLKTMISINKPSSGIIKCNGGLMTENIDDFRKDLGYVPQDDIIHQDLSVFQNFYYASRLRLPPSLSEEAINAKIGIYLRILGIEERKHLKVRKLSGGQRKRVNIGIELIADPKFLILDEPASGLDPATEEDLLILLNDLKKEKKTIILTTHSMEYLNKVDRLLIMMEGYLIFNGTLSNMKSFFGIIHSADLFKKIRDSSAEQWHQKFTASQFLSAAALPMGELKR
ncbi:MAG: hypothetical protein COA79_17015 [Planctomycetota bacterium]|nr:MAG: hypothetical protein COA79_17015 [Planctomycetota bacterium]